MAYEEMKKKQKIVRIRQLRRKGRVLELMCQVRVSRRLIGHPPGEGGLDERILQVKGKAKQGALTRIWACMGLHAKHVHACRYYQLFFLGLAYILIWIFFNEEGSSHTE